MNRKIIMSLVSSGVMLTLVMGATYAFFSDTGTSTGNTFSTGTLDLKLTDNNETSLDNVTASFGGNLAPGQCTSIQTLELKNSGTVAANHAEVTVANTVTDVGDAGTPADIDAFMMIDTLRYDGGNINSQITDLNANGWVDLHDWATSSGLDDLALTDLNTNHLLEMSICLHSSAGNTLQGDSVVSAFTVTLNQHVSQ